MAATINVPLTASGVQVGSANFPLTVEVSGDGPVRATLNLGEPDVDILGFECLHDDRDGICLSVEGKVGEQSIPVGSLTLCKLCYPGLFPG
jgi:hypothetical protein